MEKHIGLAQRYIPPPDVCQLVKNQAALEMLEKKYLKTLVEDYARSFFYAGQAHARMDVSKLTRCHKHQAELFAKIEAILGGPHDPQTDPVPR